MEILLIIVIVLLGPILILPWKWMLYWSNGLGLAFFALWIVTPHIPTSSDTFGDTVAALLFSGLLILNICATLLRAVIRACQLGDGPLVLSAYTPPKLLAYANGGATALIIFLMIAKDTAGSTQAVMLHLVIAAVAIILWLSLRGAFTRSIATALVAMALYSTTYPMIIISSANAEAKGASYCIYLNHSRRFTSGPRDLTFLTFLTFDKGTWTAHAILIIEDKTGTRYGNWSYRQQKFMVPWGLHTNLPTLQCPANH